MKIKWQGYPNKIQGQSFANLEKENIFISRIAMIRRSRDVDMKHHISNHELTPVIQSLTRHDETLLGGWERKSELTARVLGEANVTVLQVFPYKIECLAIDAMYN